MRKYLRMSSKSKLLAKLSNVASDKGWTLADAEMLLTLHGFTKRNTGSSHRVFTHPGLRDAVTLAAHGKGIKPIYIKIIRQALADLPK